MLQYRNHSFTFLGASFRIPDGMFLDPEPAATYENGLDLIAPENAFRIHVGFYESDQTPEEFLQDVFDVDDVLTVPMQAVHVGNVAGVMTEYHSETDPKNRYAEYVFQIRRDVVLNIYFTFPETVDQIQLQRIRDDLLQSIRA